jgi:hypothetical protein
MEHNHRLFFRIRFLAIQDQALPGSRKQGESSYKQPGLENGQTLSLWRIEVDILKGLIPGLKAAQESSYAPSAPLSHKQRFKVKELFDLTQSSHGKRI